MFMNGFMIPIVYKHFDAVCVNFEYVSILSAAEGFPIMTLETIGNIKGKVEGCSKFSPPIATTEGGRRGCSVFI